ncbi:MAG: hypothetical protein AAF757_08075 [Cyanobacteria bacterium P01_D01_bin.116]
MVTVIEDFGTPLRSSFVYSKEFGKSVSEVSGETYLVDSEVVKDDLDDIADEPGSQDNDNN